MEVFGSHEVDEDFVHFQEIPAYSNYAINHVQNAFCPKNCYAVNLRIIEAFENEALMNMLPLVSSKCFVSQIKSCGECT